MQRTDLRAVLSGIADPPSFSLGGFQHRHAENRKENRKENRFQSGFPQNSGVYAKNDGGNVDVGLSSVLQIPNDLLKVRDPG